MNRANDARAISTVWDTENVSDENVSDYEKAAAHRVTPEGQILSTQLREVHYVLGGGYWDIRIREMTCIWSWQKARHSGRSQPAISKNKII